MKSRCRRPGVSTDSRLRAGAWGLQDPSCLHGEWGQSRRSRRASVPSLSVPSLSSSCSVQPQLRSPDLLPLVLHWEQPQCVLSPKGHQWIFPKSLISCTRTHPAAISTGKVTQTEAAKLLFQHSGQREGVHICSDKYYRNVCRGTLVCQEKGPRWPSVGCRSPGNSCNTTPSQDCSVCMWNLFWIWIYLAYQSFRNAS